MDSKLDDSIEIDKEILVGDDFLTKFKPINEYSFRELYNSYCIIKHKKDANVNQAVIGIDNNEDFFNQKFFDDKEYYNVEINVKNPTNGFLTHCYIDHDDGMSFLYLANVLIENNKITFYKRDNYSCMMRHRRNSEYDIMILDENDSRIIKEYKDYAEKSASFYTNEKLEELRNIEPLDSLRNEDFPDDIFVGFYKDGVKQIEGIWVRLEDVIENSIFIGDILNQPYQDEFGLNMGDSVPFILLRKNDKIMAYAMLEGASSEKSHLYIDAFMDNYL